jgi:alkylhydroperoxidase family enzyme
VVLDYAVGMCSTPADVSDELFAALRAHFSDAQIIELTHVVALENMRGRFYRALGIGSAGYSDGMVCVIPESHRAG